MAIKVSGTSVINDSRQLQNIASLDSATTTVIAAAAGGGAAPEVNWSSPQHNYTSSGSWSIPGSISDTDYITFYLVGGGGPGRRDGANPSGGSGAAASLITVLRGSLGSSVSFTIGSGGVTNNSGYSVTAGGPTSITLATNQTFSAQGASHSSNAYNRVDGLNYAHISGDLTTIHPCVGGGIPKYSNNGSGQKSIDSSTNYSNPANNGFGTPFWDSTFGGAAGGSYANYGGHLFSPGTSTYAGNGGAASTNSNPANGSAPGGGAGSSFNGVGSGGAGSLRIYY